LTEDGGMTEAFTERMSLSSQRSRWHVVRYSLFFLIAFEKWRFAWLIRKRY
jgi:hypothetical protein